MLLSKINELVSLSPEAVEWIENHIDTFHYKKNDIVLAPGKTCHYIYFLHSGILCGTYNHEENEICSWISIENEFATSYYSFIQQCPSYESIECMEACVLEGITFDAVQKMYTLFPETERLGRLVLEDYYTRLEERLISIKFKSTKERYTQLMAKKPELILRMPLGRIASYLGMKQETLSRIRSER